MVYLAVVRLRALIAPEAEVEQAKVQEVALKRAIHDPAANASDADNQKEDACRALIKAGEIPRNCPLLCHPSRKACQRPKLSKPPLYCESVIISLVI